MYTCLSVFVFVTDYSGPDAFWRNEEMETEETFFVRFFIPTQRPAGQSQYGLDVLVWESVGRWNHAGGLY